MLIFNESSLLSKQQNLFCEVKVYYENSTYKIVIKKNVNKCGDIFEEHTFMIIYPQTLSVSKVKKKKHTNIYNSNYFNYVIRYKVDNYDKSYYHDDDDWDNPPDYSKLIRAIEFGTLNDGGILKVKTEGRGRGYKDMTEDFDEYNRMIEERDNEDDSIFIPFPDKQLVAQAFEFVEIHYKRERRHAALGAITNVLEELPVKRTKSRSRSRSKSGSLERRSKTRGVNISLHPGHTGFAKDILEYAGY